MFTSGDMDVDCEFRESWFCSTAASFRRFIFRNSRGKTFAGYPHRENYDYPSENELEIEKYPWKA